MGGLASRAIELRFKILHTIASFLSGGIQQSSNFFCNGRKFRVSIECHLLLFSFYNYCSPAMEATLVQPSIIPTSFSLYFTLLFALRASDLSGIANLQGVTVVLIRDVRLARSALSHETASTTVTMQNWATRIRIYCMQILLLQQITQLGEYKNE